jgi:hypothetical protein
MFLPTQFSILAPIMMQEMFYLMITPIWMW